jgi:hypothetical protein
MFVFSRQLLALSITAALLAFVLVWTSPLSWSGLLAPTARVLFYQGEQGPITEPGIGLRRFYEGENAAVEYATSSSQ